MTKQSCPTCAHEKLPLAAEPCWTCSTGERLNSQWTAKPAPAPTDCDTCAHDDTPDTLACDACGATALATGERWTLHTPKQALSDPRAHSRTIPITPAPFAQPEPVSQALAAPVRILKAPSGEPLAVGEILDEGEPTETVWPRLAAVAALAFCAGISFGLLVANLGAHQ